MKKSERKKLKTSVLDDYGREINNPKPLFIPVDSRPSLKDRIQRMIRQELSNVAGNQGFETFEQSNDFDIDDEFNSDMEATSYQMQDEILSNPDNIKQEVPPSSTPDSPSGSEASEPPKGGDAVSETPSEPTEDPDIGS